MADKYVWDPKAKKMVRSSSKTKKKTRGQIETEHAIKQNQHLDKRVETLGGKKKKGGPSVVSRVFDVLSRPSYAINEGIRRVQKAGKRGDSNPLDDFFKGAGSGLAGKDKTSFAHVLEEGGMAGGWQRSALGLAGDIFLDPTTYM